MISNWDSINNPTLYQPTKPGMEYENPLLAKLETDEDYVHPILTIRKSIYMNNKIEDGTINTLTSNPPSILSPVLHIAKASISSETQKRPATCYDEESTSTTEIHNSISIKINPRKTLDINPILSPLQTKQLF